MAGPKLKVIVPLAGKGTRLLPLTQRHGLDVLWITCNPDNIASRRTCERLGATLVDIIPVPKDHELYARGDHQKCTHCSHPPSHLAQLRPSLHHWSPLNWSYFFIRAGEQFVWLGLIQSLMARMRAFQRRVQPFSKRAAKPRAATPWVTVRSGGRAHNQVFC